MKVLKNLRKGNQLNRLSAKRSKSSWWINKLNGGKFCAKRFAESDVGIIMIPGKIVVSWIPIMFSIKLTMKNLFVYYLVVFLIPIPVLFFVMKTQPANLAVSLFFFYIFIYRGITDSLRLLQKGTIRNKDIWKMFVGFGHITWFKQLYLEV